MLPYMSRIINLIGDYDINYHLGYSDLPVPTKLCMADFAIMFQGYDQSDYKARLTE